jgi:hypothetical protein
VTHATPATHVAPRPTFFEHLHLESVNWHRRRGSKRATPHARLKYRRTCRFVQKIHDGTREDSLRFCTGASFRVQSATSRKCPPGHSVLLAVRAPPTTERERTTKPAQTHKPPKSSVGSDSWSPSGQDPFFLLLLSPLACLRRSAPLKEIPLFLRPPFPSLKESSFDSRRRQGRKDFGVTHRFFFWIFSTP